jgi:predicted nuclease of restriction endonuclease-like RecB superfamily
VLTADLVNARRRGGDLCLVTLDDAARERALELAGALVEVARAHVGRSRDDLAAGIDAVDVGPREHRLKSALGKLIEDRCEFDANESVDSEEIRRLVFTRASAARTELGVSDRLDRRVIIEQIARERGGSAEEIEHALFSDLRGTHVVISFVAPTATQLVSDYEQAQAQAVLLRAVKVTVDVQSASAGVLRDLFRKLKFLRLLHTIERRADGCRIVIDGPFSLFESVTKYGLQLALVLPALSACARWQLEADLRWGKERAPLRFRLTGNGAASSDESPRLPDDVETFLQTFRALDTVWKVSPNADILDLPGVGLCVPDLVFERRRDRAKRDRIYLEVMGYWSRAAVWKRVELVQAGLGERILFAVSSRLRVSEDVLDSVLPGALYVYKQTMNARAVAERLDNLSRAAEG